MIESFHDHSFVDNRFDLLFSCQLVLSHDFHRIESTGILLSNKNNSTEGTSTDHFDLLEVMAGHLVIGFLFLSKS